MRLIRTRNIKKNNKIIVSKLRLTKTKENDAKAYVKSLKTSKSTLETSCLQIYSSSKINPLSRTVCTNSTSHPPPTKTLNNTIPFSIVLMKYSHYSIRRKPFSTYIWISNTPKNYLRWSRKNKLRMILMVTLTKSTSTTFRSVAFTTSINS